MEKKDHITHLTYPKNLRVLMVEDNEISRLIASKVVKKIGWQMDSAENGIHALEKLRLNKYDVVLMDIHMPEMDGIETTVKIRTELKAIYSQTPIIACTPLTAELANWKEAGMDDYISKPFNEEELIRKVMTLLKNNTAFTEQATFKFDLQEDTENTEKEAIINLQKLSALSGNCKTTVNNIIQVFLKHSPKQLENLIALVTQKDWHGVKKLSHKMKSSYAIIGANAVKKLLETMEEDCSENNVDEVKCKYLLDKIIGLNEEVIKSMSANCIPV